MKKFVKKYGDSLIVNFTKDEKKLYNLKVDDVIDVTIDKPVDWKYVKQKVKKEDKKEQTNGKSNSI